VREHAADVAEAILNEEERERILEAADPEGLIAELAEWCDTLTGWEAELTESGQGLRRLLAGLHDRPPGDAEAVG
jgi:hypothetical protein